MLLGSIFERFAAKSPLTVMARGLMETALNSEHLDTLFAEHADEQYTRTLLFSSVVDLMSLVVCRTRPSICAAYRALADSLPVSLTSVYNKLDGLEPQVSAALVRHSTARLEPVIRELGGQRQAWLPGYRVKILDGNHLAATEHRLPETRDRTSGPLPGMALVVLDPSLMLAIDVFPCENGHAQERSLFPEVLATVCERDVWIDDRNFCTLGMLFGMARRKAFFVTRQHKGLPWQAENEFHHVGKVEGGEVWEQTVRLEDEDGSILLARRIKIVLEQATRDGEWELFILTNLPCEEIDALTVARLYRKRWTIETMFQELALTLESEIDTLCYPKAALFGFCVGLVAYNLLSAVKASLAVIHGAEKVEKELSAYYVSDEVSMTYRGMMIAIPEEEWTIFARLSVAELAAVLRDLAGQVRWAYFQKSHRGPKKPRAKRKHNKHQPHVATAKLLEQRKKE